MTESSNSDKQGFINWFLAGLFLSAIAFSPFVLDLTLSVRLLIFALFGLILVYHLYSSQIIPAIKPDITLISYSAFVLFTLLSIFWSINRAEALFGAVKNWFAFCSFLFCIAALHINGDYFLKYFHRSVLVITIIALVAGAWQMLEMKGPGKESLYLVTGINGHKNLFSSFLFLCLFFLLNARKKLSGRWKGFNILAIIVTMVMLCFLRTKAVWLGLVIAFCFSLLLMKISGRSNGTRLLRSNLLLLLIPLAGVCLAFFLLPEAITFVREYLGSSPRLPFADTERLTLWQKTFHVVNKNPLFGVGAGNWQIVFPDATLSGIWRAEDLNFTFQRPHNDLLWILAETGITGLFLFMTFVFSILFFAIKQIRSNVVGSEKRKDLILACSFIIGYYCISFFDFPSERAEHLIWINLILGYTWFNARDQSPRLKIFSLNAGRKTYLFLLVVSVFTLITMFFRYLGEYKTRKVYEYRNEGSMNSVVRAGNQAVSFAYNIDPTSVPLHWYTANALIVINDLKRAHHDFLKAYKFSPFNRNVLNDLASSYTMMGDTAEAIQLYKEASRISPRFDDPLLNLAAIYIHKHDFDKALFCVNSIQHDSERRNNYTMIIKASLKSAGNDRQIRKQ